MPAQVRRRGCSDNGGRGEVQPGPVRGGLQEGHASQCPVQDGEGDGMAGNNKTWFKVLELPQNPANWNSNFSSNIRCLLRGQHLLLVIVVNSNPDNYHGGGVFEMREQGTEDFLFIPW